MFNITMPQAGQTTDESQIVKWYKKTGDKVKRGDILFSVESDKAVMDVESYCDGFLIGIRTAEGDVAAAGDIVAYVGGLNELGSGASGPALDAPPAPSPAGSIASGCGGSIPVAPPAPSLAGSIASGCGGSFPVAPPPYPAVSLRASPKAKKLARDNNIRLDEIAETVAAGAVKYRDVKKYIG